MDYIEHYKLDGHTAVPCPDFMEWAEWFAKADRIVAHTELNGVIVSTIFLGIDHNFVLGREPYFPGGGKGGHRPLLFETMVFGGPLDQEQVRYSTWEEADKGHTLMVRRVVDTDAGMCW